MYFTLNPLKFFLLNPSFATVTIENQNQAEEIFNFILNKESDYKENFLK